jgi:hypothetical protein
VDEALHNYVLFIPNFHDGKGIILANDRPLSSYGLKNKVRTIALGVGDETDSLRLTTGHSCSQTNSKNSQGYP